MIPEAWNIEGIKRAGFRPCGRVSMLQGGGCSALSAGPGVYLAVRHTQGDAVFLPSSCGCQFKGRNPTVAVSYLQMSWVPNAAVLYIGKANCLRKRIDQFVQFGKGKPIGHWGGRYVWQLEGSDKLWIYYQEIAGLDPGLVESQLIAAFKGAYGKRPFANLMG